MRVLVLIVVLIIIVAIYFASIVKSFKVKFDGLANVVFSNFDFNSFLSNQTAITTRIKLLINFSGAFSISISNLNIKVYKNNTLVAESTKGIQENIKKINLKPNIDNIVFQTLNFNVNSETGYLILNEKSKKNYVLNYQVSFKLFGFPVSKSGTYNRVFKIN